MLRFRLERADDRMKRYQKMKRRQWAHLGSMKKKCDTARGMVISAGGEAAPESGKRVDNISWADVNLTGPKNKEKLCGRFNCYNWMMKI
jgi:hypothetical protein